MSTRKKKMNDDSIVTFKTQSIGYTIKLPSGNEFTYTDVDNDSVEMESAYTQSDDLSYDDGTTVCDDVIAIAVNASDETFEQIIKDLREIRKVHHNFNIDRGYL